MSCWTRIARRIVDLTARRSSFGTCTAGPRSWPQHRPLRHRQPMKVQQLTTAHCSPVVGCTQGCGSRKPITCAPSGQQCQRATPRGWSRVWLPMLAVAVLSNPIIAFRAYVHRNSDRAIASICHSSGTILFVAGRAEGVTALEHFVPHL